MNIGIVAFSPTEAKLVSKFPLRATRVARVFPGLSPDAFKAHLLTIREAASNVSRSLAIAQGGLFEGEPPTLDELLPSIVPLDNNCFRWSSVRPGLCRDVQLRLEQLANELLGTSKAPSAGRRKAKKRSRNDFYAEVQGWLRQAGLAEVVKPEEVDGETNRYTFPFCWVNGKKNVLDVLSLEVDSAEELSQRAFAWRGRMDDLSKKVPDLAIYSPTFRQITLARAGNWP
jgi:hypothetical protein